MRYTRKFVLVAALFMLPIVFGCQTMQPETAVAIPAVETAQDQALSKSVRDRLLADKKVDERGRKAWPATSSATSSRASRGAAMRARPAAVCKSG